MKIDVIAIDMIRRLIICNDDAIIWLNYEQSAKLLSQTMADFRPVVKLYNLRW